jgi:rhamnosyltransferase
VIGLPLKGLAFWRATYACPPNFMNLELNPKLSPVGVFPKIAVCLAAFNGMSWIAEQLDSILAQSSVNVTVFVSVDQSTDGTEQWIDTRALKDSRIVVLPHGQRFGGAARNFFRLVHDVDFSDFDYVSFADQDDFWFATKLARADEILRRTGADAYSSNVIAFWPTGRRMLINKSQPQKKWDFLFEAAGPGCTYVMKVDFIRALQGRLHEQWDAVQQVSLHDWFAYAFARANGYKWVIDDQPGMLYRQHAGNQVGVNEGWRAFLRRASKVRQGWWLGQAVLIAQLVGVQDDPFVRSWRGPYRFSALRLACYAGECRRRPREQILFALSCLVLFIAGNRYDG